VLLRGVFVNRGARNFCISSSDLLSLPDEVLKQVSIILGQQEDLGMFDDDSEVFDELVTF